MHHGHIQPIMLAWIFLEVRAGQFEERRRRTQAIFLQMHEGARQLDEPFVKRAVRAVLVWKPDMLQDIMRLVKKLPVEAMKVTRIMRVNLLSAMRLHHRGHACTFAAHILTLQKKTEKRSKVCR